MERDPEEREEENFLFKPQSLQVSINIDMGESRSARRPSWNTLTLQVIPPSHVKALSYANLKVDYAIAEDDISYQTLSAGPKSLLLHR